jgi:hypothetical protein
LRTRNFIATCSFKQDVFFDYCQRSIDLTYKKFQ